MKSLKEFNSEKLSNHESAGIYGSRAVHNTSYDHGCGEGSDFLVDADDSGDWSSGDTVYYDDGSTMSQP